MKCSIPSPDVVCVYGNTVVTKDINDIFGLIWCVCLNETNGNVGLCPKVWSVRNPWQNINLSDKSYWLYSVYFYKNRLVIQTRDGGVLTLCLGNATQQKLFYLMGRPHSCITFILSVVGHPKIVLKCVGSKPNQLQYKNNRTAQNVIFNEPPLQSYGLVFKTVHRMTPQWAWTLDSQNLKFTKYTYHKRPNFFSIWLHPLSR